MRELMLATKFGSPLQMVTKVGSQILATKFGFVPDLSKITRPFAAIKSLRFALLDI